MIFLHHYMWAENNIGDLRSQKKYIDLEKKYFLRDSFLVEHAGKFSMLHRCMHSKFLINTKNTKSRHGEFFVEIQN